MEWVDDDKWTEISNGIKQQHIDKRLSVMDKYELDRLCLVCMGPGFRFTSPLSTVAAERSSRRSGIVTYRSKTKLQNADTQVRQSRIAKRTNGFEILRYNLHNAENHFLSVPCDENTNWNVETVEDPVQENLLDRRPSEGTDECSNQNNNSVEARNTEQVPAPIQHLVNTSDPWISLLPHEDAVKRIPIRHSQMRAGCYLQAVQEESGEGEEYGDTDESEESEGVIPNSLPAPTRNKQRLNVTQTNNSNTINRKVKKCQPAKRKTGSRTKGF
ncbi:hypothetical protein CLF_108225 [Clonorchis sinensis]|uniref:Uncharacterized protein n=1 Tax=Clonorchis sinensis TaxID=79923 RepID=G7YRE1_CLOSI|nr:hypothetical protein CLF_108225 [Clonorchis sinensis]